VPSINPFGPTGNTYKDVRETVHTMTSALVDGTNGNWQTREVTGAETPTFNFNAPGQAILVQYTVNGGSFIWTNVDVWLGEVEPGSLTDGDYDFVFKSIDEGTVTQGQLNGKVG
jgi:hypothetical protein